MNLIRIEAIYEESTSGNFQILTNLLTEQGYDVYPAVSGDKAMLRIVLVNLIANAFKFTRPRQQARIGIGSQSGQNSETASRVLIIQTL